MIYSKAKNNILLNVIKYILMNNFRFFFCMTLISYRLLMYKNGLIVY